MPLRSQRPLAGWRVLVPRGGEWGNSIAATLRAHGAEPVVVPLVNFAGPDEVDELASALTRLRGGEYDWLLVTTAATVDVLVSQDVDFPAHTRLAAVGENTVSALRLSGYPVDFVPDVEQSVAALIEQWSVDSGSKVLVLSPEASAELLRGAVGDLDVEARTVVAYRTVGIEVPAPIRAQVSSGEIGAVLITSESVAHQIRVQLAPLPSGTLVAAIGPRTASDTRAEGITVDVVAEELTDEALIRALVAHIER
ncbi:MAG TPA: uroporphyrinogen-III synthase [Terrimesophilobacter sp.]|nr:uroporphyrinogen-III synthase [Terrimesophilobacter sp.]